jgi:hypothetical protein
VRSHHTNKIKTLIAALNEQLIPVLDVLETGRIDA